ncbi:hypothetical protein M408DRAFT_333724 [Serendipita vermifera MAFF 305830]|uniref:Uncharacterized protein n=1 Tax=Serendipita vermifera MAFF 305830 TaxID=933852 RepID=A0A0C3A8K9_SERVB|nr:hypothetical protein M408DRAFT_333724 [Serendipita vermifera MAFF 305830]
MGSLPLPVALIWILLEFVEAARAAQVVTVDDTDPRITYTGGNWTTVQNCEQCPARLDVSRAQGGSFHIVNQANSRVEFEFTGIAVSVYGVVSSPRWRTGMTLSNISFTIDGNEQAIGIANANEREYNKTLFQADNLPNHSHTFSIQTHDDSLFVVDYLTYTTDPAALAAVSNGTSNTDTSPFATYTSDQGSSSASSGAQPAVVGGVIGGIFGTFLIAGIVGLWFIRRANRRRRSRKGSSNDRNRNNQKRSPVDKKGLVAPIVKPGGGGGGKQPNDSGGSSDPSKDAFGMGFGVGGKRKEKRDTLDYAFGGKRSPPAHASVPLTTTRRMEALSAAAMGGAGERERLGGYRSATSTYTSGYSNGMDDGKSQVIHALTTDTPQEAHPAPLYDVEGDNWAERGVAPAVPPRRPPHAHGVELLRTQERKQRPFSSGSTLEVDGVLERVMVVNHSSSPAPWHTRSTSREEEEEPSPRLFLPEHPFRTMA